MAGPEGLRSGNIEDSSNVSGAACFGLVAFATGEVDAGRRGGPPRLRERDLGMGSASLDYKSF